MTLHGKIFKLRYVLLLLQFSIDCDTNASVSEFIRVITFHRYSYTQKPAVEHILFISFCGKFILATIAIYEILIHYMSAVSCTTE